jgi:GNAT superfamily N-acetyltransferase
MSLSAADLAAVTPVDVSYRPYRPSDSDAALALERRSAQGAGFQLRFERPWFHRRAENFEEWQLVTAWADGALIGVAAGAVKAVMWKGTPGEALYIFDVRVAPEARRRKVAQRLIALLLEWGGDRGRFGYGYAVADNAASIQMCRQWIGARIGPAAGFLAYPTYKAKPPEVPALPGSPLDIHAAYLAAEGPFDLYSDPTPSFSSPGFVGSWMHSQGGSHAGCSAWSNQHIFAEVVVRLPPALAIAGTVLRRWPIRCLPVPRIPRPGERVRSWYIFDFHASDDEAAVLLMETVAAEAKMQGIDYCYVIHRPGRSFVNALRRPFLKQVAPVIPYSIIANHSDEGGQLIAAPYIDIRDV